MPSSCPWRGFRSVAIDGKIYSDRENDLTQQPTRSRHRGSPPRRRSSRSPAVVSSTYRLGHHRGEPLHWKAGIRLRGRGRVAAAPGATCRGGRQILVRPSTSSQRCRCRVRHGDVINLAVAAIGGGSPPNVWTVGPGGTPSPVEPRDDEGCRPAAATGPGLTTCQCRQHRQLLQGPPRHAGRKNVDPEPSPLT